MASGRVLRLLVKDVLVGPEKITIRHRIPIRTRVKGVRDKRQRRDDLSLLRHQPPGLLHLV